MATSEPTSIIKKSGRPAYLQIADHIRDQIASGELPPDSLLPSTAQLCARYGVSQSVVKAAVGALRSEGLVIGQQGKGVYVRSPEEVERPAAAGDDPVLTQLGQIREALQTLSDRLTKLEAEVFPAPGGTRPRGR